MIDKWLSCMKATQYVFACEWLQQGQISRSLHDNVNTHIMYTKYYQDNIYGKVNTLTVEVIGSNTLISSYIYNKQRQKNGSKEIKQRLLGVEDKLKKMMEDI